VTLEYRTLWKRVPENKKKRQRDQIHSKAVELNLAVETCGLSFLQQVFYFPENIPKSLVSE
jgi:hypothetical protein